MSQITQGCPHLLTLDIGYCYRILNHATLSVGVSGFPPNLTELTLHGVQMSSDLLVGLVDKLSYIKRLSLCGVKAVDDDTLEQVSFYIIKFPILLNWTQTENVGYLTCFMIDQTRATHAQN